MTRRRWAWLGGIAVTAVASVTVLELSGAASPAGQREPVAAAWLPVWDPRSAASLRPALEVGGVTEVSPTWLTVDADGELVATPPADEVLRRLDRAGTRVLPTVQNFADGEWQGQALAGLLAEPSWVRSHRDDLVALAEEHDWAGIDIDYEALPPTAGPVFTDFLAGLRDDLHERGMELTVAVPARAADDDPGTLAYSYQRLGEIADQVRVMTYDHSWSTSGAGPVAPVWWVEEVIGYAVERVPRDKLMLGLATYGYDWVDERGKPLGAQEAVQLADEMGAEPVWHEESASWTFSYVLDGEQHTVWYEDARSLAATQELAREAGLRGVVLWQIGGEDPQVWPALAEFTGGRERS